MKDSGTYIGKRLKNARIEKGLTQSALGKSIGMPQGHISKIESGLVDLQTSTLIEISRILDLELMLVPLTLVRSVHALERKSDEKIIKTRPMYRLEEDGNEE